MEIEFENRNGHIVPVGTPTCCPRLFPNAKENPDSYATGYDWHQHQFRFTCGNKNLKYVYPEGIKEEDIGYQDRYKYITGESCPLQYVKMRTPWHDMGEEERYREMAWAQTQLKERCEICDGKMHLM